MLEAPTYATNDSVGQMTYLKSQVLKSKLLNCSYKID